MRKKLYIPWSSIALGCLVLLFFIFISSDNIAFAQEQFEPMVPLPGGEILSSTDSTILPKYIINIFRFGIWLAVALSVIMIMVAGFMWTTAGGSPERVSNAKSYIASALTGLIIALLSFAILQSINPQLVNLQFPKLESVSTVELESCCVCWNNNGQIPGAPANSRVCLNNVSKDSCSGMYGTDQEGESTCFLSDDSCFDHSCNYLNGARL